MKAQVSMEYMMVALIIAVIVIPIAYIAFSFSKSSGGEIAESQINRMGNDIVRTAEKVYYQGAPSRITLTESMPEGVKSMQVNSDIATGSYELVITAEINGKISEFAFPSKVNIAGAFPQEAQTAGIKEISIQSFDGQPPVVGITIKGSAPVMAVSHSPASIPPGSEVSFTASWNTAGPNINIYVDDSPAKSCSASPCVHTQVFPSEGTHSYYAEGSDLIGSSARDPPDAGQTRSFTVSFSMPPPCGNYGDVDYDGLVTSTDDQWISEFISGLRTFTDEQKIRADVTGEGDITSLDSLRIQRYLLGWDSTFPVCGPDSPPSFTAVPDDSSTSSSPTTSGSPVMFTATASDPENAKWRLFVCKTNAISNNVCSGGNWCSSSFADSASPASCSYTTALSDIPEQGWYAFACDNSYACSAASTANSPFFVEAAAPSFTLVPDDSSILQNPTVLGNSVTFRATASHPENGQWKLILCKTDAESGGACPGGSWCSSSLTASGSEASCSYPPSSSDAFSQRWYAFACDSSNSCSQSSSANSPFYLMWAQLSNPTTTSDYGIEGAAADSSGVYVAGTQNGPDIWRIEKRSLSDGSLLWSQTSNPSSGYDQVFGVALDSTRVYIAGSARIVGINYKWRVEARNTGDGALAWFVESNPSSSLDIAQGIAVDSTGIYVIGNSYASGNSLLRIEKRSLSAGALVWSTEVAGIFDGRGAAVDSTGLYVAGYDVSQRWRMEKRSLSDGSLIWSQTSDPSASDDVPRSVVLDSSGAYFAGYDSSPGNSEWRIEKRNLNDGSLIWEKVNNPSSLADILTDISIDSSGIYVAGYDGGPGNYQWRVEKRSLDDGALIWQFTENPSSGDDEANAIAAFNGAVYVAGRDSSISPSDVQWRIEKRAIG